MRGRLSEIPENVVEPAELLFRIKVDLAIATIGGDYSPAVLGAYVDAILNVVNNLPKEVVKSKVLAAIDHLEKYGNNDDLAAYRCILESYDDLDLATRRYDKDDVRKHAWTALGYMEDFSVESHFPLEADNHKVKGPVQILNETRAAMALQSLLEEYGEGLWEHGVEALMAETSRAARQIAPNELRRHLEDSLAVAENDPDGARRYGFSPSELIDTISATRAILADFQYYWMLANNTPVKLSWEEMVKAGLVPNRGLAN